MTDNNIMQIIKSNTSLDLLRDFFKRYPGEAARLLDTLTSKEILEYLKILEIYPASEVFSRLNPELASGLVAAPASPIAQDLWP